MKNILIIAVFLSACFISGSVFAKQESWYTYWSIGKADHTYPGEANDIFNEIESLPGVERSEVAFDMLGFYVPTSSKNIVGFVISMSADRFAFLDEYVQINQYLYGISNIHFTGKEIGDGFFYRLDAGIAKTAISASDQITLSSDAGMGVLGALGYSIPISSETRLLLGASYSIRSVESEETSIVTFEIGALF